jgi:hypothetical protein
MPHSQTPVGHAMPHSQTPGGHPMPHSQTPGGHHMPHSLDPWHSSKVYWPISLFPYFYGQYLNIK